MYGMAISTDTKYEQKFRFVAKWQAEKNDIETDFCLQVVS